MKVGGAALAFALAALVAAPARADDDAATAERRAPDTIVVVADPGQAFGRRVVAELEALGLRASIVAPVAAAPRTSLESIARAGHAVAAIRGVSSESGVEVWITDRATGKTVLRELPRGDGEPDDALALRTVELFRAGMLEASLPPPPPVSTATTAPQPPIDTSRLDARRRPEPDSAAPTLRLAVEPALVLSPGGVGPTVSLAIGLAYLPTPHFGANAFLAVPLLGGERGTESRAGRLAPLVGGGGIRFALTPRNAQWTPTIDTGLAYTVLSPRGAADPGTEIVPYLATGLSCALTKNLRARADVLAAVGQSATVKLSKGGGSWGMPIVIPAIGLDTGWF